MGNIINLEAYKNKISEHLTVAEKNCVLEQLLEQMKASCQNIVSASGTDVETGYLWKQYEELFATYYRQMNLLYPNARDNARAFIEQAERVKLPYEDYKNSLPELPVAALTMVIPVYTDMIRNVVFEKCPSERIFECIDFYYFVWEDIIERFRCLYHLEPVSDDATMAEINQELLLNVDAGEVLNEIANLLERSLLYLHLDKNKFLACSEALWYLIKSLET